MIPFVFCIQQWIIWAFQVPLEERPVPGMGQYSRNLRMESKKKIWRVM